MTFANDARLIDCKEVINQFKAMSVVATYMLTAQWFLFALHFFKYSINMFYTVSTYRILKSNTAVEVYLSSSSVLSIRLVHKSMVQAITS